MSETIHPNWNKLAEASSTTVSAANGNGLRIDGLPRDLAVRLGFALTVELDQNNGRYRPSSTYNGQAWGLSQEQSLMEATRRADEGEAVIFGEERPAERNMAVRVSHDRGDTYSLVADVRNELEDFPDLQGGLMLQLGFVATIESIDFGAQDS